jgi:hypothetical protein
MRAKKTAQGGQTTPIASSMVTKVKILRIKTGEGILRAI